MKRVMSGNRKITLIVLLITIMLSLLFAVQAQADPAELGKSGWVELNGAKYYGNADGTAVTGQWIIDDDYYFFDDTGVLQTGWVNLPSRGWKYYQDGQIWSRTSSAIQAGWRYANEQGKVLMSLKGLSSIEIPSKVDNLPGGFFAGVTKDFMVVCEKGSYAEKIVLSLGLPYNNGSKKTIGTGISDVDGKVSWIVENYITPGMSEREKALVLHNWLIYNAHYDYSYSQYGPDGVLIKGAGVCDSYSKAYGLLLTKAGIENRRLTGDAGGGHAWNLVRIDGQWYHVDTTWDDPNDSGSASVSGYERETYFLVNDAFVKQSRTFDEDVSADSNYVRWVQMGSESYYYGPDGKRAAGWLELNSDQTVYDSETGEQKTIQVPCRYYFNAEGVMQTGFVTIEGKTYYFSPNGVMQTGFTRATDGNWYYMNAQGEMQTGWQDLDNSRYFFDSDGKMYTGMQTVDGDLYWFMEDRYVGAGSMCQDTWRIVDDQYYYFGSDGKAYKGFRTIGEYTYYFDAQHIMATGWKEIDGKFYYFGSSGAMYKGCWIQPAKTEYYYVCELVPFTPAADAAVYHLESDGGMTTGLVTFGSYTYYFSAAGELQTGLQTIGDAVYYFGANGLMQTGLIRISDTVTNYFGTDGRRVSGDVEIDGETYRFGQDGALIGKVNKEEEKEEQVIQVEVTADENGELQIVASEERLERIFLGASGWISSGGSWYYGDASGYAALGPVTVDGTMYCFDEQGHMVTGWAEVMGKWYYAKSSGAIYHNGWMQVGKTWYYFRANGEMAVGWVNDGGTYYYMSRDGEMQTGWVEDEGKWYYMDKEGAMQTGWMLDGKTWYLLKSSGEMATGWTKDGGTWYYFKSSGAMAANEWIRDKAGENDLPEGQKRELWYWFDKDGAMATGWKEINRQWEMFSGSGEWLYTWDGK